MKRKHANDEDTESIFGLLPDKTERTPTDGLGDYHLHIPTTPNVEMKTPYNKIRDAIYSNDTERLNKLIDEEKLNINLPDERGNCHLHIAAFKGHDECVQILLANGAGVNARDGFGNVPLHFAAKYKHIKTLEVLSEMQGVDFDAINQKGGTALKIAAFEGHDEVVRVLLEKGAKVDIITQGETLYKYQALHLAAKSGHVAIVQVLIDAKADVNARDEFGNTPIIIAAAHNHLNVVNFLLTEELVDVDAVNEGKINALHYAACIGSVEIVQSLLRRADVNALGGEVKFSALHIAAEGNHPDIARILIGQNANIDLVDDKDNAPIHIAANNGNTVIVKLLLAKKAKFNEVNKDGMTPLLLALKNKKSEVAIELIREGADLNLIDKNGDNPLCIAASNGLNEVIDEVLNALLVVEVLDGNREKVDIINKKHDIYQYQALHLAVIGGHDAIVKTLIKEGAKLDAPDLYGNTPLLLAIINKKSEVAITLIKEGSKIDTVNNQGDNALEIARFHGLDKVVEALSIGKVVEALSKIAKKTAGFNPTVASSYKEACVGEKRPSSAAQTSKESSTSRKLAEESPKKKSGVGGSRK
jgi:ankyrin repeat protein